MPLFQANPGMRATSLLSWRCACPPSRPTLQYGKTCGRHVQTYRHRKNLVVYSSDTSHTNLSEVLPLPQPPQTTGLFDVIPYILKLAAEERNSSWRIGASFICIVASKIAGLSCPLLLKSAVDCLSVKSAGFVQACTMALVAFGLCDLFKHIAKELQQPLFTPLSQAVSRRVAYQTFSHVLGLDIGFHLNRRTGRLSRILERGTRSMQMLYRATLFTIIPTMVELVLVLAVLIKKFNPVVAGLVFVTFSLYVSWTLHITQLAAEARKLVNKYDNRTSSKAVDALLNYETVALFDNQQLELQGYDQHLRDYQQASLKVESLAAILNMGQSVILTTGLTVGLIAAVRVPLASGVSVASGDIVLIQGLLLQLWTPLQFLGYFYRELRQSLVDVEEFFRILLTKSRLVDGTLSMPDHPPPHLLPLYPASFNGFSLQSTTLSNLPSPTSSSTTTTTIKDAILQNNFLSKSIANGSPTASSSSSSDSTSNGNSSSNSSNQGTNEREGASSSSKAAPLEGLSVEFKNVVFGYTDDPNDQKVLRGLNLRVRAGQRVAVVGPSGSGKSSLLKLITRLYDVQSGSVEVNGVDVRQLRMKSLRGAVAVVPQDTVLFNDSIMDNIRYGRPGASDAEVEAAAWQAQLYKALEKIGREGLKTRVGERGLKLSGGEKQRVAIARAFLRQPRLLVCDEATSALDSGTEQAIMDSLNNLAEGRTAVFVAHRLSTIQSCDCIFVLDEGRVVEEGSHEQLMDQQGRYWQMWQKQAASERISPYSSVESSMDEDEVALGLMEDSDQAMVI